MKLLLGLLLLSIPAHARPFVIGAISDINGTECQPRYPVNSLKAFENLLKSQPIDHLLIPGDAVHGECTKYEEDEPYADVVRSMWDEFDRNFYAPARALGLSPVLAPGNHDAPFLRPGNPYPTFVEENLGFQRYWENKRPELGVKRVRLRGESDRYPYYFAYTHKNILFIVLQSTTVATLSDGANQKKWLKALFSGPEARRARLKIAMGHVPPYPVLDPDVGPKYSAVIHAEQVGKPAGLMDLLLDNGVRLLIAGHSHAPYPAELTRARDKKKMLVLSMPCGHAPRALLDKSEPSPKGYALIEIGDDNKIKFDIRDWQTGLTIPYAYFPEAIPLPAPAAATYKKVGRALYP